MVGTSPKQPSAPAGKDDRRAWLFQLASTFRDAIERADRSTLGISFRHFPKGACGDTTPLLGHFMKACGAHETVYTLGERGQIGRDWTSHAWLRVDSYIVDITADQFDDVSERVIVARSSPWHETFEVKVEHEADFTLYDAATGSDLATKYAVIMKGVGHGPFASGR